jgi:DNA ligase 1
MFQPMLACPIEEEDLPNLTYPIYAQYKYDGIRCIIKDGKVLSRKLKPIPNKWIREEMLSLFKDSKDIFDGELIFPGKYNFNDVQSAVMSEDGIPYNLRLALFDRLLFNGLTQLPNKELEYRLRKPWVDSSCGTFGLYLFSASTECCQDVLQVLDFEEHAVKRGFEGIILRSPSGVYKYGRSTLKQQYLLKLKRLEDAEGKIISVIEQEHNHNIQTSDERGYAKRSSHQDNKSPSGMVGSFLVEVLSGEFKGVETKVSAGSLTHEERIKYWLGRKELIGKVITFKYSKNRTTKDRPLEPRFKSFYE